MLNMRSTAACLAAIATAALLAGCGGVQARFESHMRRGEAYFKGDDFAKASIEFGNAMQIRPKNPDAMLMAGRADEKLGRARAALGLYQAVVDSSPDNLEARGDLARLLVESGATSQALKIIQPGLDRHPDDVTLLVLRAAVRAQQQDLVGATADAERALQLDPTDEEAVEVRAGLYRRSGDFADAAARVRSALRTAPRSRPLHEMLVDLYGALDEPDLAQKQLQLLIGLAPQEPRYRYQLAISYSRAGKLDDAQHVLEGAVKALPKSDDVKLALVDFLSRERTPAQGEQVLRGFVAAEPDDVNLRLGLGALLERVGSIQQAIDAYDEVIRREGTDPGGLVARDRIARIDWTRGQGREARKLIDEVLQQNPHDNDALVLRAEAALAGKDPTEAVTDIRAVLRDHPEATGLQGLLARAYVADGQPALAEETLRSAVTQTPGDNALCLQLARLLEQSGRPAEAITQLQNAVHRAPNDVQMRTELARAYLGEHDFADARAEALAVQTLQPKAAAGLYLTGMADIGLNHPQQAEQELTRALALQPQAFDILTSLERLDLAIGKAPQAIALVKGAVERDDKNALALNLLGELYLGQNNAALATDALKQAAASAPKWWVPHRNLALARLAAKDLAGAIAEYEVAVELSPAEPLPVIELATTYESHGRPADAISTYDAWLRRNPQVQGVAANLAMLLVTYRSDRPSLDRARDLTAGFDASSDGRLLDADGWVHFKRGEYAQAVAVLQHALVRSPDSKEVLYHLGMAELRAGETDRARGDLEAALSGSAKFFGSDEARAALAKLQGRAG